MKTANDSIDSNRPFLTRLGLRIVAIISGCVAAALLAYLIMLPVMLIGIKLGPGLGSTAWGSGIFAGYIVYRLLCKRFKLTLRSKSSIDALFEKEENEVKDSASTLYEGGSEQIIDDAALMENEALSENENATEPAPERVEEVKLNENEIKSTAEPIIEEEKAPQSEEQFQSSEEDSSVSIALSDTEKENNGAVIESVEAQPDKTPKRRNTKRIKKICLIIAAIILAVGLFFVYLSFHTKAEHEELVQVTKLQLEIIEDRTIQKQDITEAISLLKHCDESRFYCYYDHSQAIEELLDLYFQEQIDECKKNVSWSYHIAMELFKLDGTDLGRYCDKYYKGEKSENTGGEYVHNYTKIAVKILQYAAEQGDRDSQFTLGCFYAGADYSSEDKGWMNHTMLGNGVDKKKAAYWYLQAAEQGNTAAMGNLGSAYMNGKGVTRNEEKGVYWIQRAANLNDSFFQRVLGDFYRDGVYVRNGSHEEYEKDMFGRYIEDRMFGGYKKITVDDYDYNKAIIPKDIEQAKYWWRLAVENGDETAKERLQQIYD